MISLIAVLKAKPGQTDALRQALQALLLPTRQEPGNLDYALFQLRDAPDTFYMREAWQGQDALDAHVARPYFQAFMTKAFAVGKKAGVIAAVSYADVIFTLIIGYFMGDALPNHLALAGIVLVVVSGILVVKEK